MWILGQYVKVHKLLNPCHEAPFQAPVKLDKIYSIHIMNKMDGRKVKKKFCLYSQVLLFKKFQFMGINM